MTPQLNSTVKLDTGGPRITLPSAERAKAKGTIGRYETSRGHFACLLMTETFNVRSTAG